jgi:hypothetical protein
MNKLLLLITSLNMFTITAYSKSFEYDARVSDKGEIDIKINFTTNSDINVEEIMNNYFLNESFQKKIDPMLYKQTSTYKVDTATGVKYRLNLTAQKKVKFITVKNTLVFKCTQSINDTNAEQDCELDTSRNGENSRDRFYYSNYNVKCQESNNEISCKFNLKARVKGINLFVYSRTADRLAASGTQSYVTNLYKLYKGIDLNQGNVAPDLSDDSFYDSSIKKVRSTIFESMNEDDELQVREKHVTGNLSRY